MSDLEHNKAAKAGFWPWLCLSVSLSRSLYLSLSLYRSVVAVVRGVHERHRLLVVRRIRIAAPLQHLHPRKDVHVLRVSCFKVSYSGAAERLTRLRDSGSGIRVSAGFGYSIAGAGLQG